MKEKILVPIDDSDESWNALRQAILEAENSDLEKFTIFYSEEKAGDEEYREGEKILEKAKEKVEEKNIEAETKLSIRGYKPAEDVVRFAEENAYDKIIVGHKGGSPIREVLLGSVAKGIVENAHCVVSVVRSSPYFEVAGDRVRTRTIESLMEEHQGIKKAAVIGATGEDKNYERIYAFFEPEEGYEPSEEMVKSFMGDFRNDGLIPHFAIPDQIELLEELPRTSAGTVNRDKLKRDFVE